MAGEVLLELAHPLVLEEPQMRRKIVPWVRQSVGADACIFVLVINRPEGECAGDRGGICRDEMV